MVLFSGKGSTRLAADAHYPAEFEHELPLSDARSRIVALEAELAALRALRAREDEVELRLLLARRSRRRGSST